MTENQGRWTKGQTGNPAGRPTRARALTKQLVTALGRTVEIDGKKVAGRRLLACLATEVLTTGRAHFPDGTVLEVSGKDWIDFAKWVYSHVDGPPRVEMDLTSGGEPLMVHITRRDENQGD